ncbi:crossover junction endonuclease EME1 [Vespa crabro]|uniref:crossover junction endonuclease EME1 n=1 Tax=Vespa crabro TaxID=7445 RepID=UPI001F00A006|nr:crossover junction endonuclease EME1 [Vespa crabro]XP_046813799.1 crossover junction endonuclease EME1 [Vespa crabro]
MSEVIVLSDSNESDASIINQINPEIGNSQQDSSSDDFDFPEVQFDYITNKNNITNTNKPCQRQYTINDNSKSLNVISNVETNNEMFTSTLSRKRSFTHDMSDSFESDRYEENICTNQQLFKEPIKKSKYKLKEERRKRQENLIKEKALKAITNKKLKNIKPGECIKFMKVILDKRIEEYNFYPEILVTLNDTNVSYNFISHLIPKSITWERSIEKDSVNENNKIHTKTIKQTEKHIIVIWNWNEVVEKLTDDSFCTSISYIRTLLPDYNMTLVIFGIQGYFLYYKKKNKLKNNKGSGSKSCNKIEDFKVYRESPEISKQQLEMCLAEIQIINKCNNRLIENASDLALMIYQYTKAIAEIPYKLEKKQHFDKEYNWYIAGDNRDTVRVDKDGNGLKRLWQQQLCQFNLSSLEIAEAICSVYKSPAQLVEAYMNCTSTDGSKLLKDLPIRRAVRPLSTTRRVGPELSKKVHIMFTSENGDILLGNDY